MSQKLPVNKFEWYEDASQFNEDFIRKYNKESNEGYFFKVNVQYLEKELPNYLPFYLSGRRLKNLKSLLLLKKVHTVIKFNQKAWLKPDIDMNTKLRQKTKNSLGNTFSNCWLMQCFEKVWKMWENMEILNV